MEKLSLKYFLEEKTNSVTVNVSMEICLYWVWQKNNQSSLTMPIFLPMDLTPWTTFSCIRLKHMAITAMPRRMYKEQRTNWTLTTSARPAVPVGYTKGLSTVECFDTESPESKGWKVIFCRSISGGTCTRFTDSYDLI